MPIGGWVVKVFSNNYISISTHIVSVIGAFSVWSIDCKTYGGNQKNKIEIKIK